MSQASPLANAINGKPATSGFIVKKNRPLGLLWLAHLLLMLVKMLFIDIFGGRNNTVTILICTVFLFIAPRLVRPINCNKASVHHHNQCDRL